MSTFTQFADALNKRITAMSKNELYVVGDALDRDSIWLTYLASFPEGTNPLFRQRTEHDCSTCRQFVKNWGNVVEIVNTPFAQNQIRTIWDPTVESPSQRISMEPYATVMAKMDAYIMSLPLSGIFRVSERQYGTAKTRAMVDGTLEVWDHFHARVADKHYSTSVGTDRGHFDTTVQVFKRGLEELHSSAIDTVVDLIDSNTLYRGEEHLPALTGFRSMKNAYMRLTDDRKPAFIYSNAVSPASRFRNTVIGTLVQDLSNGVELEAAVRSFESKVAPTNYKRPKALITPAMVKSAMKTITELGIESSLERRFAKLSDVSVNNVLWVNSDTQPLMKDGIEDLLMGVATSNVAALSKGARPEEVSITQFMKDVLPGASEIELLLKNAHANNFVSITTAVHDDAPLIFKWNNPFAWSYGGNVTDSIREKVKRAGGSVTGQLRISLSWFNYDDLDLHVTTPTGRKIWYGNKGVPRTGGLDVDMNAGGRSSREPVENVTWSSTPPDGTYIIQVNQFSKRETSDVGFVIETESNGQIENYRYDKAVSSKRTIRVGELTVLNGVITAFRPGKDIVGGSVAKEMWGIKTEQFVPVSTVMYSPNHWDNESVGNRHWFFILQGCVNDEPTRGLYNEFLKSELDVHRKVFEILGERTKCVHSTEQLSGVGFSSTAGSSITARVVTEGRQRLMSVQF